MSPQKLLFCYHLPTRGRAGVKLGDAWYVSNVSIIFDATCLFYTNCFMFCLHFVTFLCIFRNQPINKIPQCQFLFSAIFVFQKSYIGNILEIGQNEAQSSYFPRHDTESKSETEEGQEVGTPRGGAGPPLAMPPCVVGPLGALWHCPKSIEVFLDKVPQRRRRRRGESGDRSLCSGTLPGWRIALGAISMDSTAIFVAVVDSHDEEGVVLPQGRGLYR
jgi:hypothetical protein